MERSITKYDNPNYILVTGFSKLPKETPLSETQKIFACTLVVDRTDNRVVDASFTFLMSLTEDCLRGMVIGKKFPEDWDDLQRQINERYLVPTPGAVIQALRVAIERYTKIE